MRHIWLRITTIPVFGALLIGGLALGLSASAHKSAAATDPVIVAAGDICGSPTNCAPTANLIDSINPAGVLTLGDNAYQDGSLSQYNSFYRPNWGRQDAKVYPSPGNHEFQTANAQGYRDYFAARVPALYYSYDLGAWHVVSLASSAGVSPGAGGAEETWLKADLAAHPSQCILAYWHEARFASGTTHGNNTAWDAVWSDLYAAGADLILNGHEHNYERFARQNPSGVADPNGIREIISGTGGIGHYPIGTAKANSEIRNATTFGVLKLTLHAASYDWQFVPVAGSTFTDSGTDTCSGAAPPPPTTTAPTTTAPPPPTTTVPTTTTTPTTTTVPTTTTTPTTTAIPPDTTAPSAPVNLRITAGTRTSLTLAWDASTDNVGVTGYRVWRDGTLRLSTTGLIYSASSLSCSDKKNGYSLEVAAFDAAGNVSPRSPYLAVCSYH